MPSSADHGTPLTLTLTLVGDDFPTIAALLRGNCQQAVHRQPVGCLLTVLRERCSDRWGIITD
jgi:hypothetical protein